jgi:muconolactone D-isomerase
MATGTMKRLWQLPGQRACIGLFEAADGDDLDAQLCSLPMQPYFEVEVEVLSAHALDRTFHPATQ